MVDISVALSPVQHQEALYYNFLTSGKRDIARVVAYVNDHERNNAFLFYLAPPVDQLRHRHLYRLTLTRNSASNETCVSCSMEDTCSYVDARFSSDSLTYMLSCLGPAAPSYWLRHSLNTSFAQQLILNKELDNNLEGVALPRILYKKLELPGTAKRSVWARLTVPPQLKEEEILRFPLLVITSDSPDDQRVTSQFRLDWLSALVSSRGVVVAMIDGRGSNGRGLRFQHAVYRQLGTVDVTDQLTAARELGKLRYIVAEKIAIMGKGYGGFVVASSLGRVKPSVQCGIAVAPVIDWRYYDSVFSERHMGLLFGRKNNQNGYDKANVSQYVENFKSSKFFLIHGTSDDDVHYQHSALLARSLVEHEVQFSMMPYTDRGHSLLEYHTRRHMLKAITDFLRSCFGGFPSERKR